MLILLPVLCFFGLYLIIFSKLSNWKSVSDALRLALIYTMGGICLFTILITEVLSVVNAIYKGVIIVVWCIALIIVVLTVWRDNTYLRVIKQIMIWQRGVKLEFVEKLLLVGGGIYLVVLFLIAVISPPNNTDSLLYHLARVVHWIQNGNLNYFPVAYLNQLFSPPAAEILLLHNFLLVGGDRLVNLVQWTFMVASLVVSSLVAKSLGAGRIGQWLAVIFLLTLPVGILEATTTQNDYVGAFFILCLATLIITSRENSYTTLEIISFGVFAGLAMDVKTATYPFVAVLLIWAVLSKIRQHRIRRSIANSVMIIGILFLINLPGWLRSYQAFGNPLGEKAFVSLRSPKIHTPVDLLISPIQHLALNLGTPFDSLNQSMGDTIINLCEKLGGTNCSTPEPGEWGFRIIGLSNHEDTVGNFIHLFTFLFGLIVFIVLGKKLMDRKCLFGYMFTLIACFLLFSWLIPWGVYWGRLQLFLFALAAGFVGVIFERRNHRFAIGLAIFLMLAGLPWLLMNRTRPIISKTPDVTLVRSIIVEPRFTLLFANYPELQGQVANVTSEALKSGCSQISLKIDSRDPEYYFMAYLQPWRNPIRVDVIPEKNLLDTYRPVDFHACAQICSICGVNPDPDGLILAYKDKAMTLYLTPEVYSTYIKK